ncbi:hypothetical protein RIF29_25024 [Crotalaria pallida]|uniref:Uncharacterized protein n=1 Tax=Crotalaria pallida TaxID=3830 RepID=A0AAN9HYY0_CROPI
MGRSLSIEGVVHPGTLITLPPPLEVARPKVQRNSLPAGNLDEEEWVAVYGMRHSLKEAKQLVSLLHTVKTMKKNLELLIQMCQDVLAIAKRNNES